LVVLVVGGGGVGGGGGGRGWQDWASLLRAHTPPVFLHCGPHCHVACCVQAGGKGSTGVQRVLDIIPEKVHQRVPLFVGSTWEVEYLESFMQK
jgi:hypothetical protein